MGTLEEVKQMQKQGIAENEIVSTLQQKGTAYKEISDALAQSKIKEAIEQPAIEEQNPISQTPQPQQNQSPIPQEQIPQTPQPITQEQIPPEQSPIPQEQQGQTQGMQQSILQTAQTPEVAEYAPEQGAYEDYDYADDGGQYEYASPAMSADTITEISEQIVSEKMNEVRKKLENMISFKTNLEVKTESIEERLKRIEKIIDNLQSSILQKVGNFMTNTEDVKKELIETQKSFKKLSSSKKPKEKKKSKKS